MKSTAYESNKHCTLYWARGWIKKFAWFRRVSQLKHGLIHTAMFIMSRTKCINYDNSKVCIFLLFSSSRVGKIGTTRESFDNMAACITCKEKQNKNAFNVYRNCIECIMAVKHGSSRTILLRVTLAIKILCNNFLVILFFASIFLMKITLFRPAVMLGLHNL